MRRRGFTLIELLIVIGIIVVLLSLIFAALKAAWEQARRTACMSNLRQVSAAYMMYAASNDSRLYPCDVRMQQAGLSAADEAIVIPELLPFAPDPRVFHCPKDEHADMRSYSVNDYLGGTYPAANYLHAEFLKDVHNAAATFLFIEETPSTHQQTPAGGFVVLPYPSEIWVDAPGVLHGKGTCMSFVDGHCECREWSDLRTPDVWKKLPYYRTAKNADLVELQRLEGFGDVPQN